MCRVGGLRAGRAPADKVEEEQPPVQDAHQPHVVQKDREPVHLARAPEMDLRLQPDIQTFREGEVG